MTPSLATTTARAAPATPALSVPAAAPQAAYLHVLREHALTARLPNCVAFVVEFTHGSLPRRRQYRVVYPEALKFSEHAYCSLTSHPSVFTNTINKAWATRTVSGIVP